VIRPSLQTGNQHHWFRNAIIGSTLAARAAGIVEANRAAAQSNTIASISQVGSQGVTLNNWLVISLPAPIAAGTPTQVPRPLVKMPLAIPSL